ncbi:hypothetical protein [Microtetraspora sp. NBRC 16547]|uniref:hypothetical protein n=1 Tax=Microtetraspora sp. NBRC 16547 TaxID=3030993 RepID=UPI0024A31792|nr:hypothetical protein [Microtetraspora sp. NBRC 16547]GLX00584.1 hypothetical protein Misp02_46700 [Microtetraspora sp. NBRC 16547]
MGIWRIALLAALVLFLGATMTSPAQAVTAQKKVLVQLREQGGFAGIDDRVTVYTDGCVRLSRRTGPAVDACLTSGEIRGLRRDLKQLRLGSSETQPPGADFIQYTLSYQGHRTARYTLPSTWSPVVRRLEKILQKYWAPA